MYWSASPTPFTKLGTQIMNVAKEFPDYFILVWYPCSALNHFLHCSHSLSHMVLLLYHVDSVWNVLALPVTPFFHVQQWYIYIQYIFAGSDDTFTTTQSIIVWTSTLFKRNITNKVELSINVCLFKYNTVVAWENWWGYDTVSKMKATYLSSWIRINTFLCKQTLWRELVFSSTPSWLHDLYRLATENYIQPFHSKLCHKTPVLKELLQFASPSICTI